MQDPKPVTMGLMLVGLGVLALGLWFVGQSEPERWRLLAVVHRAEHVATLPPTALLDQAPWLMAHRWQRIQGVGVLGLLALVIGCSEGLYLRHTHARGGFLLTAWTCGALLFPVLVAVLVGFLCAPWPIATWIIGTAITVILGAMSLLLACGRPATP